MEARQFKKKIRYIANKLLSSREVVFHVCEKKAYFAKLLWKRIWHLQDVHSMLI